MTDEGEAHKRARRTMASSLGGVCALIALACRPTPPPPTVTTRVGVRVPAAVVAASMPPSGVLTLLGRRTPGTLQHRGFLLAVLCTPADLDTDWAVELAGPATLDVWLEPGYANDPNTPCGVVPEGLRRDIIAEPPEWHPHATARVTPGQTGVALVLANNGTGRPALAPSPAR